MHLVHLRVTHFCRHLFSHFEMPHGAWWPVLLWLNSDQLCQRNRMLSNRHIRQLALLEAHHFSFTGNRFGITRASWTNGALHCDTDLTISGRKALAVSRRQTMEKAAGSKRTT